MYIFIVNPVAGSGRSKQLFKKLQKSDIYKSIEAHFIYTQYEGHATELATELSASEDASKIRCLIIVGGDGTIHEVFNGLTNRIIPVSFLIGGSGNDFARGSSMEGSPEEILERIIHNENPITYWPSTYRKKETPSRIFANSIGFGFDAVVAKTTNESIMKALLNKIKLGKLTYAYSLIKGIINFKPLSLNVTIEGETRQLKNCWIALASNHPYIGGGIKLAPNAKSDPSQFTVLLVHSIPRWKVLLMFATVFLGKHTLLKEVEEIVANQVEFEFQSDTYYQVDGEVGKTSSCMVTKESGGYTILGTNE